MTAPETRQNLFNLYVNELATARDKAMRRQEGRLKTWTRRLGSEARAREKLDAGAPACTDTRVIGVLRKYWLACDSLNRVEPASAVEPSEFLLGWLTASRPHLAAFLEPLPYWPMAKDEKGNWA